MTLGFVVSWLQPLETEMTAGEQKMLNRGVAVGMLMGLALSLMIARAMAMRPDFFAALLR